jgi:N-acetylneuraminic acid mutarotase
MLYGGAGIFAASDGISVYAGGGLGDFGTVHNDLMRYDPVADSWAPLPPSPDYYFAAPGVYFNGKIYIFGGYDETFQAKNTTRIYDISTGTWTTGAPMPAALAEGAALWNGIVYIPGGSPDVGTTVVDTLYAYNIASNSWSTLEPMPQGLWLAGIGIMNTATRAKLYVAAGSDGHTQLNTLYIYDIAGNTWTTGANVPFAEEAGGSAVLHNKLYVFGGLPPLLATQVYDPVSDTWSPGPMPSVQRWRFVGTAVGNHSIVGLGGQPAIGSALDTNEWLITNPCPRPHATPRPHPTPRH